MSDLRPLREMAAGWLGRRDNLMENSKLLPEKDLNMIVATACAWEKAADQLLAFCDAAEAVLNGAKEGNINFAVHHASQHDNGGFRDATARSEVVDWVNRALIGSRTDAPSQQRIQPDLPGHDFPAPKSEKPPQGDKP